MAPRYSPERPGHLAESAFRLFAAQGIQNVNLDQIASTAGVTKGSLYWHYRNKSELLLAACDYYYRTYRERLEREIERQAKPADRLKAAIRLSVQLCLLDHENRRFTMEILTLAAHDKKIRASWTRFYQEVKRCYADLIAGVSERALPFGLDASQAAGCLLEVFEGIKLCLQYDPDAGSRIGEERRITAHLFFLAGLTGAAKQPTGRSKTSRRVRIRGRT